MRTSFFWLLMIALLFTACPDDDDGNNLPDPALQLDMVTGFNAFTIDGSPNGTYGNPNTFPGDLAVFPVPAVGEIQVQNLASNGLEIINFWLVPAVTNTTFGDVDYTALLDNESYSADEISTLAVPDNPGMPNATAFTIGLDPIPAGYYRLFLQTSDERIFWENIYLDPNGGSPEQILQEIAGDW